MSVEFRKSWTGSLGTGLLPRVETELRAFGMTEGERLIRKVIDHKGISFQGDLKKSVTTNVDRSGHSVQLSVGPDAEYAKYVFKGTRPHWAPIAPLKEWAAKKLGDEQAGYAVQWKIAREGTDPRDFLTGPARMMQQKLPARLENAISDHLEGQ